MVKKHIMNSIKFSFALFIVALTGNLFAQEKVLLNVEWLEASSAQLSGKTYVIPRIKDQGYEKNVPNFYWIKEVDAKTDYSFTLFSFETSECPKEDIDFIALNGLTVPQEFTPTLVIRNAAEKTYAVANFFPYVEVNGQIRRIASIAAEINSNGKKPHVVAPKSFAAQSVLREGTGIWYKISVTDDGIHKIDKAFLESAGISTTNLNPNHINIFGNGEGMLPESNSVYRTDDLAKNAIQIVGGNDGSFDDGDYILFYGFGPNKWHANGLVDFSRRMNTYSNESYYFININSNETPLRIQDLSSSGATPTDNVSQMDYRLIFEKDEVSLVKGGQRWYGDLFDVELSRTYNFSIPNVAASPINYKMAIAANASGGGINKMVTTVNGNIVDDTALPSVGLGDYARATKSYTSNPATSVSLNLTVTRTNPKIVAYLDFITVNARRDLVFFGTEMGFRDLSSVGPGNISKFSLSNFSSNNFVWDITDRHVPKRVLGTLSGSTFEFVLPTDTIKEFVASNGSSFKTPEKVEFVAFQNLHGLPQADYVIVSHPSFLSQAERLADIHRAEGLTVHVVTEKQIFNEFSSGMRDATAIRFFMKMFYDRAVVSNDPPKYLLLFGDGTFDHRGKTTNENYIMTYQVDDSENHVAALVTDDYFGLLDNNESISGSDLLDIGIGRLLISSTQIANEQVNKIQHYMENGSSFYSTPGDCDCAPSKTINTLGDWRLKYVQIADDPDLTINYDFVNSDTEPQVDAVDGYRKEMNPDKIYCDAFQQVSGAGGQRFPGVVDAINDRIRRGALVIMLGMGERQALQKRELSLSHKFRDGKMRTVCHCWLALLANSQNSMIPTAFRLVNGLL
jgi:Peptidase family C25